MTRTNVDLENLIEINKRAYDFRLTDLRKTIELSNNALKIVGEVELNPEILKEKAFSLAILGNAHTSLGEYEKGMENARLALEIYESQGWIKESLYSLSTTSLIYLMLSDNTSCLEYCHKQLELAESVGSIEWKADAIKRMGAAYSHKGEYEKALDCHVEALDLYMKLKDINNQAKIYHNFSIEYKELGQFEKAIEYGEKSLEYFYQAENVHGIARIHSTLSGSFGKLGKYDRAFEHSNTAIDLQKKSDRKENYALILSRHGNLLIETEKYDEGIEVLQEAVVIGEETTNYQLLQSLYKNLAAVYKQLGQFEKAVYHYDKYSECLDKDINQRNKRRYDNLETLYRLNKAVLDEREKAEDQIREAYDLTLEGWAYALELRDKETEGHSQRVTMMSIRFAEHIGYSEQQITYVRRGALLHDIGKMGTPDGILLKKGDISEEEMKIIREHPIHAKKMLEKIDFLEPSIVIPYSHHENWDGTGYPEGLSGRNIPEPARLFAIIDNWDALTSSRPYRKAWSKQKTMDYIHNQAGKKFDPDLVSVFFEKVLDIDGD